ncbi:putative AC transposase [Nymphaea thermarum]|nr:putative AC transposase [Nymphaea thermarum]
MTNLRRNILDKDKQVCGSRLSSDDVPIGVHSSNETPIDSEDPDYEGVSIDDHEERINGAKRSRSKTSTVWNDFDEVVINGIKKGKRQVENVAFQVTKSEIDTYLDDRLIKHDSNGDAFSFNILQWWKDKESKYRILSQLARDLLSIPITSVASEKLSVQEVELLVIVVIHWSQKQLKLWFVWSNMVVNIATK